jgi:hypothetical protein
VLFIDPLMDELKDAARMAVYFGVLRNLIFFKQKPSTSYRSRGGVTIDEIVLHGTKSLGTQEQSANPLATPDGVDPLLHRPRPGPRLHYPPRVPSVSRGSPKHRAGVRTTIRARSDRDVSEGHFALQGDASSSISPIGSTIRWRCCTTSVTEEALRGPISSGTADKSGRSGKERTEFRLEQVNIKLDDISTRSWACWAGSVAR